MKHLYGLLFLFVVLIGSSVQPGQRIWEVTCGLPQQDNPFLELMPAGYSGPWFGSQDKGHYMVKSINRSHPESTIVGEMWILSQSIGWWIDSWST